MPGSILGELILQPILELVFHLAGYVTGRIVVPTFTFGYVRVERLGDKNPGDATRWYRRKATWRDQRGSLVLDADLGAGCGILFWILAAVVAFLVT
jgi:hypothetical protein